MKLNYNLKRNCNITLGIFTFVWMLSDYFENKKDININYNKANQAFIKKNIKRLIIFTS